MKVKEKILLDVYGLLEHGPINIVILGDSVSHGSFNGYIGEHNTIPMIRVMLPSLKTWGAINDQTKVYLSHLAPRLHKSHDETVELVAKDGMLVAYDGLELDF